MIMYENGKHVCMLPRETACSSLPPTAGLCHFVWCRLRALTLPTDWHYGSTLYIRSQKCMRMERKKQVDGGHWFILHPYSAIKLYWDCFAMVMNCIVFLWAPMHVFLTCPDPYDSLIIFGDIVALLDIYTKFVTGRDGGSARRVILEPREIARHYIRGPFVLELIGALPLQFIQIIPGCEYPTYTVMYLFKLFKLISLKQQWRNLYRQVGLSYAKAVATTVVLRTILFFHWMTYIHYQVPTFVPHFYELEGRQLAWLKEFLVIHDTNTSVFQKYTRNLYFICGLCVGADYYSAIDDHLLPQLILNSTIGLIGLVFLSYTFTTLLRLGMYGRIDTYIYNGRLKELEEYMWFKRLPTSLQQKIKMFLNYKFYAHYFNEENIMNTINEQIKQDINMHCCKKLVVNVPLFQDMPLSLINTIVFSLTQVLYMPGEEVIKCGQTGGSIYMISSGTVAVIDSNGKELAHLRDGAYFGESALLNPGSTRTVTIIALEITEMFKQVE
ncbi:potassium/sodium hyperpolarization-activated cyclic nucleotide-gated channel 1-like [Achroia grisella]|uniref:potassium/sodium hyperpolarization-activated cyclic nucleotide-gated channel 1-like n=1 Tax=Achroia grisella TaxID=688607 RepID=UPI0027D29FFD|nr:potassium/sodium hyperpolarization-activated cyclic nucleotide-gated channel 1-like [Achroia grisella]